MFLVTVHVVTLVNVPPLDDFGRVIFFRFLVVVTTFRPLFHDKGLLRLVRHGPFVTTLVRDGVAEACLALAYQAAAGVVEVRVQRAERAQVVSRRVLGPVFSSA